MLDYSKTNFDNISLNVKKLCSVRKSNDDYFEKGRKLANINITHIAFLLQGKGLFLCVTTYAGNDFTLVRNYEREEEASRRISLLVTNSLEKELSKTCIHIKQQTCLFIQTQMTYFNTLSNLHHCNKYCGCL